MFLFLIIYLHSVHMQSCDVCINGPFMGEDSASSKLTWQWKWTFEDVVPIEDGDFPLPC